MLDLHEVYCGTMGILDWLLTMYVGPGSKVYRKINFFLEALDVSIKSEGLKFRYKAWEFKSCKYIYLSIFLKLIDKLKRDKKSSWNKLKGILTEEYH